MKLLPKPTRWFFLILAFIGLITVTATYMTANATVTHDNVTGKGSRVATKGTVSVLGHAPAQEATLPPAPTPPVPPTAPAPPPTFTALPTDPPPPPATPTGTLEPLPPAPAPPEAPTSVPTLTPSPEPVDVMLVIDGSDSISSADFELAREFARRVVESCILQTDARVGVIQFSTEGATRPESPLSDDNDAVVAAIDAMQQINGLTDIQEGLDAAQNELDTNGRADARQIIILLTDGTQTQSGDPVAAAAAIKAAGTRIFVVAVGVADLSEINAIASDPDSVHVFSVDEFEDLESVLAVLLRRVCDVAPLPIKDEDEGDVDSSETYVTQFPNPNLSVVPGGMVTYTILVRNIGEGDADNVTVTMPFDPAEVQVVDAVFSQDTAWVRAINNDNLVFETGRIQEQGGVVTATVRLLTLPTVPNGTSLSERLSIEGNGVEAGREFSNRTILTVGSTTNNQPFYPLVVAPASAPAGSNFTFASSIFVPNEPVTFWYNTPTGASFEITRVDADGEGTVNETFISASDLPGGTYSMVAYGNWSQLTSTTTFVVQGGSGDEGGGS